MTKKIKNIIYLFIASATMSFCTQHHMRAEDHIRIKEIHRGNSVSDVSIYRQKKYIDNYRVYYYRANKNDLSVLEDSIILADLGDDKFSEVPWY